MTDDEAKALRPFQFLLSEDQLLLSTSDREEALAAASEAIWPMSVEFRKGRGLFKFDLGGRQIAGLDVAALRQASDGGYVSRLEPLEDDFIFEAAVHGRSRVKTAGFAFSVEARSSVLCSPGEPIVWDDAGAPYEGISIRIPAHIIDTTFSALTGTDAASRIKFDPKIDTTTRRGRELRRLIGALIDAASDPDSLLDHPVAAAQFQDLLAVCLLTGFEHDASNSLRKDAPGTGRAAVERARDYIDAHSAEAITSDKLAKISGASIRSLQRSFRDATGTTPMQYLKLVRLERVRSRLLQEGSSARVTEIAMSEGFGHLGHFAADYRRAYGETPTQSARVSTDSHQT